MKLLPPTVSVQDVQRKYRQICQQVQEGGEPVIVLNHGKPDLALISIQELERLYTSAEATSKKVLVARRKVIERQEP